MQYQPYFHEHLQTNGCNKANKIFIKIAILFERQVYIFIEYAYVIIVKTNISK